LINKIFNIIFDWSLKFNWICQFFGYNGKIKILKE
jgi:hypothetical protein